MTSSEKGFEGTWLERITYKKTVSVDLQNVKKILLDDLDRTLQWRVGTALVKSLLAIFSAFQ